MKDKKLGKKLLALTLAGTIAMSTGAIFSACGQKDPPPTNPPGTELPGPEDQTEKVAVATILNEYFASRDLASELNASLKAVASKKVEGNDVKSVEVVSFEKGTNGKIVLNVKYKDELSLEDDELTITADTTKIADFYNAAINLTTVQNAILAENNVSLTDEVEKDGTAHTAIKEDCASAISKINAGKTALEGISATNIEIKEETPIEYVSVQSLVDEVFAGIDFDANLKETAAALVTKKSSSTNKMNKLLAFDFEISKSGNLCFYVEQEVISTGAKEISSLSYTGNITQLADYINLTKDFNNSVGTALQTKSVTLSSQIDKNSTTKQEIVDVLNTLKNNYNSGKTIVEQYISIANIAENTFFVPTQTDLSLLVGNKGTKAFAEALINHYDVADFTMDDVVAVYVGDFSGEAIDYSSRSNILVLTKQGIKNYEMWARRSYGDMTNRYSMILNGNENSGVTSVVNAAEYSNNAVVYDAQENRITENLQASPYAIVVGSKIVGAIKDDKIMLF